MTLRIEQANIPLYASQAKDHFITEYEKNNGIAPIIEERDDPVFRWLIIQFPLTKAKVIISKYLSMKDDWFEKHNYSLQCMKRNINRVLKNTVDTKPQGGEDMLIAPELSCDSCFKYYIDRVRVSVLTSEDYVRLCPSCKDMDVVAPH